MILHIANKCFDCHRLHLFDVGDELFMSSEDESVAVASPVMKKLSLKKTPKRVTLAELMANMLISSRVTQQTVQGIVPIPMLSIRWEIFNHDDDSKRCFVCMRMLLHNGTNPEEFHFSWVDERTFKICVKWPKFMVKCLMMTRLDMALFGNKHEVYPVGHRLSDSMGENAMNMKQEGKEDIFAEGLHYFDRDMIVQRFNQHLFEVPVGAKEEVGTIL